MRPGAYETLDSLGLPRPLTYNPQQLLESPDPPDRVLLRFGEGPGVPRIYSRHEALQLAKSDTDDADPQLTFEEAIDSGLGGCLLHDADDELYVELVDGHISGLLLHGWVGFRWLSNGGGRTSSVTRQQSAHRFRSGRLVEERPRPVDEGRGRRAIEALASLGPKTRRASLVEFVIAPDQRLLFVDEKEYPTALALRALFSPQDAVLLEGDAEHPSAVYDGPLDAQVLDELPPMCLRIHRDDAVLSHFVTRGLSSGQVRRIVVQS